MLCFGIHIEYLNKWKDFATKPYHCADSIYVYVLVHIYILEGNSDQMK
jgi:hypothetical protein